MHKQFQWVSLLFLLLLSMPIQANNIVIENPYIRESIPGNNITSAYMTITNGSTKPITLTSVISPISKQIEIHNHLMENGLMKMRQIPALTIQPNNSVTLQPMGLHLMMLDLDKSITAGEKVTLTLNFKHAPSQTLTVPVSKIKRQQAHHHH